MLHLGERSYPHEDRRHSLPLDCVWSGSRRSQIGAAQPAPSKQACRILNAMRHSSAVSYRATPNDIPTTERCATPGEASRRAHDIVWAGPRGCIAEIRNAHGIPTAVFTKIADRAIEVRNLLFDSRQYEYNPSVTRPQERHWSPQWPPTGILYSEGAGL